MKHPAVAARVSSLLGGMPHVLNISSEKGLKAEVSEGVLSHLERWTGGTATLKLNDRKGRPGFASAGLGSGRFDASGLVRRAFLSASVMAYDPAEEIHPVSPLNVPGGLALLDAENWEPDGNMASGMAFRLETAARALDKRVTSVRKPAFEAVSVENTVIVNGATAADWRETFFSLHAEVAAGPEDDPQFGWAARSGRALSSVSPEETGEEAALRAVELLGAKPPPTGFFPVLLDGRVGAEILDVLAPSFFGENMRKKTSLLNGLMGREVFSGKISIVDDGLLPGGDGTRPVDDEGTSCRANECVREGMLAGLLYSRGEAARQGVLPTGNGFSDGEGPPQTGVTNFYIRNGTTGRPELLKAFKRVVLIRELMGLHTADPISGDFSVGFSGLMIQDGEIAHPVSGGAVSGNLRDLFRMVVQTGNDLRFHGGYGSPTLLVEGLSLSG